MHTQVLVDFKDDRTFEQFAATVKEEGTAEKRYQHFMDRLAQTINKVLKERHILRKWRR